ncbi:MAG: AIR synthase-related protein [Solirubrobacteraceae bacterium]
MTAPANGGRIAYGAAGVDYDTLDAGKRDALTEALATSAALLAAPGGRAIDASRGEPAFVFEVAGATLAIVLECLGTKSIIARLVEDELGAAAFSAVAYDTVAAIVNDLCCVGALPLVVNAYFATGSSQWYQRPARLQGLLEGWRRACADAGATWGGGESPSLTGLVADDEIELAGSAVGIVPSGRAPLLGRELAAGDEIVLVASSGLHANGASLARKVAESAPDGYRTRLGSGATLGEALLTPSVIYVGLVRALLSGDVPVHYLSHITGHGLLKLMRPQAELSYVIERLPPVPEVLSFLVARTEMEPAEAYATFNMGCGFAVYCAEGTGDHVVELATGLGLAAQLAGRVRAGERRVVLEELGVAYDSGALDLAPRRRG